MDFVRAADRPNGSPVLDRFARIADHLQYMTASRVRIVIIGGGGHARVVADIIDRGGRYHIAGYCDPAGPRGGMAPLEFRGDDVALAAIRAEGVHAAFVALGDNAHRARLGALARRLGFDLPAIPCPSAVISPRATIGAGAMIGSGAIVNAGARIDEFAIVNTRASIDHDCRIGAAAHVAPGAILLGNVTVGPLALVGAGATIINHVELGAGATVGAGAVVAQSVGPGMTVAGVPARPVAPLPPRAAR